MALSSKSPFSVKTFDKKGSNKQGHSFKSSKLKSGKKRKRPSRENRPRTDFIESNEIGTSCRRYTKAPIKASKSDCTFYIYFLLIETSKKKNLNHQETPRAMILVKTSKIICQLFRGSRTLRHFQGAGRTVIAQFT